MLGKYIFRTVQLDAIFSGLNLDGRRADDPFAEQNSIQGNANNATFILAQSWIYKPTFSQTTEEHSFEDLGPLNSFTIHGLWKYNTHGLTFSSGPSSECSVTSALESSQFNTPDATLEVSGRQLLEEMKKYWKGSSSDQELWKHEYNCHGNFLENTIPSYNENHGGNDRTKLLRQSIYDYFKVTTDLFKGLDTMQMLNECGIEPSLVSTYTLREIQAALSKGFHGLEVYALCQGNNVLSQVRYFYNLEGSFAEGNFEPITCPLVKSSNCAATGIRFLPKGLYERYHRLKGFISAKGSGFWGVLIGSGNIFPYGTSSNAATFWLTELFPDNYCLTSSHGNCNFEYDGKLVCSVLQEAATKFQLGSGLSLGYDGNFVWSALSNAKRSYALYGSSEHFGFRRVSLVFKEFASI